MGVVYLYLHRDFWFYCWVNNIQHKVTQHYCIILPDNAVQKIAIMLADRAYVEWEDRILNGDGVSPKGTFNVLRRHSENK